MPLQEPRAAAQAVARVFVITWAERPPVAALSESMMCGFVIVALPAQEQLLQLIQPHPRCGVLRPCRSGSGAVGDDGDGSAPFDRDGDDGDGDDGDGRAPWQCPI